MRQPLAFLISFALLFLCMVPELYAAIDPRCFRYIVSGTLAFQQTQLTETSPVEIELKFTPESAVLVESTQNLKDAQTVQRIYDMIIEVSEVVDGVSVPSKTEYYKPHLTQSLHEPLETRAFQEGHILPRTSDMDFEKMKEISADFGKEKGFSKADPVNHVFRVRKDIRFEIEKPAEFLGSTIPPGVHQWYTEFLFSQYVHFVGADTVGEGTEIEVHFMPRAVKGGKIAPYSASQSVEGARQFLELLKLPQMHLHTHILFDPYSFKSLWMDPDGEMTFLDYFRRINLVAEMISTVEDSLPNQINKFQNWVNMHPLQPDHFRATAKQLQNLRPSEQEGYLHEPRKFGGNINLVFPGSYFNPLLMGLEFRSIHFHSKKEWVMPMLDSIQGSVLNGNFTLSPEHLREWSLYRAKSLSKKNIFSLRARFSKIENPSSPKPLLEDLIYHQSWSYLFSHAPFEIHRAVGLFNWDYLKKISEFDLGVKALVWNWSNDTVTFKNEALKKKIRNAQVKYLAKILETPKNWQERKVVHLTEILGEFFVESGLYEAFLNSVGIELKTES